MTEPLDDARGELLACPFCGGKAHDVGPYGEGLFAVRCNQCGGGVSGFDQCRQDAIDAWNTRAPPSRSDAESVDVRAKLYELLRLFRDDCLSADETISGILQDTAPLVPPPSEAGRVQRQQDFAVGSALDEWDRLSNDERGEIKAAWPLLANAMQELKSAFDNA